MRDNDLIDWTMSPAPDELEPGPQPELGPRPGPRPSVQLRWALPRRAWLMLAGVTFGAVLVTVFGLPWLERYRVRRAVEQVIALETAAIAASDWEALRALYDTKLSGWAYDEINAIRLGGLPVSLRAYGGWPPEADGFVRVVKVLEPKLAEAEVVRQYRLNDGSTATLAFPQFYRFAETGWVRTQPPDDWWGKVQYYRGARVDMEFQAVDAAYATVFGDYLDNLLVQACRQWACPPELRGRVSLAPKASDPVMGHWGYSGIGSLTFGLLTTGNRPSTLSPLVVPSPQLAGSPQDEATLAAMRRPVAVQLLVWMAQQSAPVGQERPFRPFFYALVARELARLGQDSAALTALQVANPLFSPEQMWAMAAADYRANQALPEALVVLNHLLDGQSLAAEAKLFQTVHTAADLITWLSDGLGLAPDAVLALVAAALDPPLPVATTDLGDPDLALGCRDGIWLASLEGHSWPLLAGEHPNSHAQHWSPDGRRLVVSINGRHGVIDLQQRIGGWLPKPIVEFDAGPQWVNDTTLAYAPSDMLLQNDPALVLPQRQRVEFYDVANPGRQLAALPGFVSYQLSPDGTLAAGRYLSDGLELVVIPALGGEPVVVGVAAQQAYWSPDSHFIAYVRQNGGQGIWSIHLTEVATGNSRQILSAGDPGLPESNADIEWSWAEVAWSPQGDELAVFADMSQDFDYLGWVGLLRPDGTGLQVLNSPVARLRPWRASFSADGRYLAVGLRNTLPPGSTGIYDLSAGRWVRVLPDMYASGWSATGHALALTGAGGTYLLLDARHPDREPVRLPVERCTSISWRPGSPDR